MPDGDPPAPESLGALDLAVFLVELALLAALAVAGSRLVEGASAVVLAVLLPLSAAVLWGLLLAPRASRRLAMPARLFVKLGLVVVAAALLAASDALAWGIGLLVVSGGLIAAGELRSPAGDRPRGP
jgi:Protein of unknown function (DUF2568)